MGVILGSKAVKSVWEPTVQWLSSRSQWSADGRQRSSTADMSARQARQRRIAEDPTL